MVPTVLSQRKQIPEGGLTLHVPLLNNHCTENVVLKKNVLLYSSLFWEEVPAIAPRVTFQPKLNWEEYVMVDLA